MTLREKVEKILSEQPQTRNSDIDLTLWVWYSFFKDKLEWQEADGTENSGRWIVPLSNVRLLPSEDKISRIRRKLQEQGKYPANDPVVKSRRKRESSLRNAIKTAYWDNEMD